MLMSMVFRWLAVFVLALAVSVSGSLPVFALGLIVHEAVSNTLAILVQGLLAAISASWLADLFRVEGARSRLLSVVAATETAAAVLAAIYFGLNLGPASRLIRQFFPVNIFLLAAWGVILTVGACLAARHYRGSTRSRKQDAVMSVIFLGLALAVIIASLLVAALFGLTGA